jgi:formiminotetrahydrofolate cyclodeaminase
MASLKMTTDRPLADLHTKTLIELIGSSSTSPGSGAAGAIALALAAACAAKAVAVSAKHSPDQTRLTAAHTRLDTLRDFALQGADIDAVAFTQFIRNHTTASATNLAETGQRMEWLIKLLFSIIEEVEPFVTQTLVGDLVAARALGAAARTIQSANEAEARAAAEHLAGQPTAKPGAPPATTA